MRAPCAAYITILSVLVLSTAPADAEKNATAARCKVPSKAPSNIEKVIALCQEEIKQTLIAEALEALDLQEAVRLAPPEEKPSNTAGDDGENDAQTRRRRSFFTEEEQKIAGCLLQCVFRRKNALNALGYPTVEGMVHLYTEGVDEQPYVLATVQAVHTCLNNVRIIVDQNERGEQQQAPRAPAATAAATTAPPKRHSKAIGTTCEVAYHVFDCVSDKIQEYCGQSP